ncbi:TetR/AcrR family transcriptional regulator C-terminal domain-containing protein [Actinocorallia sp. API 0066]|uniref:TetR/AcrR family transcriptional regulator n=1 Tax=Actinocorallia sp. API 0066 TaxID=2896846 RepID=UPI001E5B47DD|nr:TetR/AcrR family transcriptional regulator C-terminal domain-containing protein [Actinocorallia sp. API 0066]MCD0449420.1 TetR/AcrR family transcriptional regulator C-terminal domain-containing protein [Actinocorallia sp. API 0066]
MAKKAATRPAERRTLTRAAIVGAAITVIERDGAKALSMRKVAAELGVGTMSLYTHVPDRDALIEEIAQTVLAGIDAPEATSPNQDWKVNARAMVGAFRAAARRHPRSMHLVLTRKLELEFSWRAAERALSLLVAAGFDGETSVRVIRTLMSYAIGCQMVAGGALDTPDRLPDTALRPIRDDPDLFPRSLALIEQLLNPDPEADFTTGLEMLLAAMDRLPRSA